MKYKVISTGKNESVKFRETSSINKVGIYSKDIKTARIIMLGLSGSGKSKQAAKLASYLGMSKTEIISSGQILRDLIKSSATRSGLERLEAVGINWWKKIEDETLLAEDRSKQYINETSKVIDDPFTGSTVLDWFRYSVNHGKLLPDLWVQNIIHDAITRTGHERFILDGYPRTLGSAIGLSEYLKSKNSEIDHVFILQISDAEALRRLLYRGREDDTASVIGSRINFYHKQVVPAIDYFVKTLGSAKVKFIESDKVELDGDKEKVKNDIKDSENRTFEKIKKEYDKQPEPVDLDIAA
ncbi:MAG: nucleoside monophosphate kinase [Candidatus Margulisbacteria bacterium]|nr:nucleoside monophosphate kinase [Candidatus Margulisiibacteriota bacterium]